MGAEQLKFSLLLPVVITTAADAAAAAADADAAVGCQVLLHEATLRLMTGANPSSHALYTVRCRRRLTSQHQSVDDDDDDVNNH